MVLKFGRGCAQLCNCSKNAGAPASIRVLFDWQITRICLYLYEMQNHPIGGCALNFGLVKYYGPAQAVGQQPPRPPNTEKVHCDNHYAIARVFLLWKTDRDRRLY